MSPQLTPAQLRMLGRVPDDLTYFQSGVYGVRSVLGNRTLRVLKERGLVEIAIVPPSWGKTEAGRAALSDRKGADNG